MSGRVYPREWFQANRWGDEPIAKMFTKETETRLYYEDRGRLRFENKAGNYHTWHPTYEEAEAATAARLALNAQKNAERRIRAAAPDLLSALEAVMNRHASNVVFHDNALADRCWAAIARAKGEA